jgi:N-acetylglucosaminyldiphosphoundecaprenol N-acetyl-beta-D-mannosaminyltransferase
MASDVAEVIATKRQRTGPSVTPSWVWGVPLSPLSGEQSVEEVARLVEERRPSLILSANLNFMMLSDRDDELNAINQKATLILADGMPVVWAGKFAKPPIPERVPGSDLIFTVSEMAAERGYSLFLLGGAEGIGELAAKNLCEQFPGLKIAGIVSPPFRPMTEEEDAALLAQIRNSDADILIMASSQPRGEKWLITRLEAMNIPVSMQIGASLDFAAGRVKRAPHLFQKLGLEWAYRLYLEPKRLVRRYLDNALFLFRMLFLGSKRQRNSIDLSDAQHITTANV